MKTLTTLTTALLASALALPALADGHKGMKHDGMHDEMKSDMMKTKSMKMGMESDMKAKTMAMKGDSEYFDMMDMDGNAEVDFTEFSNYLESNHGWNASDSAKEYVRLTSGTNGVITDRTFAGMDITKLPHKHMDGTKHKGTMMSDNSMSSSSNSSSMMSSGNMSSDMSMQSQDRTAVMGRTMTASPTNGQVMMRADYGMFTDYDMNRDGRVEFKEYSKYRSKSGVRTTQAAQEFIRFSDGQSYFDETGFTIAASQDVLNRPYYRATASSMSYDTMDTMDRMDDDDMRSMNYGGGVVDVR